MYVPIISYMMSIVILKFLLLPILEKVYGNILNTNSSTNAAWNIIITSSPGNSWNTNLSPLLLYPYLILGEEYETIRIMISIVIFPLLHAILLLSQKNNKSVPFGTRRITCYSLARIDVIITVISTFSMSMLLCLLQWSISSTLMCYMVCCGVHAANNLIYFYNVNKDVVYNRDSNGFVSRLK